MRGRAVLGSAVFAATAALVAGPVYAASPGQPIAQKLDAAFRTCALQLTERDYLTAKNREVLGVQGIALAPPPAEVSAMAGRLFGEAGIYASVAVPSGAMWIAASATVPACKVTLADTELALTGRYDWTTTLQSSKSWRFDPAQSGQTGGIMRDFFVLNSDRPGGHMIMFIDGPNSIVNDGKGIQMIMTVAFEPAKAN